MKIIVGISGASGAIYGIELLKALKELNIETHLVISGWGAKTIELETVFKAEQVRSIADYHYENDDLTAILASGSFLHDGMVVAPCSMKSLASIAYGYSDTLLTRSADVSIKEKRKLILVPRETPLSTIHLENMLKVASLNVTLLPPMPAMYIKPTSVDDLVIHTVSRILDHLGIENSLSKRWQH
jgi:flavin prenyltransferase